MEAMNMPLWIATGIALGTGLGAMMDNGALGIAVGAALGGAIGAWSRRRGPDDAP
jgi:uncharacterized membrane protein YfcA